MMSKAGKAVTAAMAAALWMGLVGADAPATKAPPASPSFERFKSLEGTWVSAEDGEMVKKGDVVAVYTLTGGGSAVVESLFPGMPHAMTTVYYMDGRDLVLTHYCMNGNQPHMKAKASTTPRIEFAFDGGANIDPKKDAHMHDASFEFVGANELKSTWVEWDGGKVAMTVHMHTVRKTS